MEKQSTIPLSIREARGVAHQIRQVACIDRYYWPWVIEQLCERLEKAEAAVPEVSPPHAPRGYRYHHADCTCGGMGGDR